jgi:hypothetical protein
MVVFVVLFVVVALFLGRVLLPGFLIFYILWRSIWPLRGIVVADRGIALVDRTFVRARPNRVVAMVSRGEIVVSPRGQRRFLMIAGETVGLRPNEYERLVEALNLQESSSPISSLPPLNLG